MTTAPATPAGPVAPVWRHPSALLLAVQMAGILSYPFMEHAPLVRVLFEGAAILVLALVVRWLRGPGWVAVSALVLGVVAAALAVADTAAPHTGFVVASGALHAFLYFATAGSLLSYMLRDRRVTRDELFAVGATFTVVAWAFAYVYVAVQALQAHAFTGAVHPDAPRSWMEMLFLSVTTLTSTGLSDIVPITAHARSVVMIEQIAGLMYVALVVSRVVGLTLGRGRPQE